MTKLINKVAALVLAVTYVFTATNTTPTVGEKIEQESTDGQYVTTHARKEIQRDVLKPPTSEWERVRAEAVAGTRVEGTSNEAKTTEYDDANSVDNGQVVNVAATFYTATCKGCLGITYYEEHDVRNTIYYEGMRIISVDPSVIPPYSIVEFELSGETVRAIALDRGGAIKGHKIDVLVSTYREAINLGRKNLELKYIRYGK